MGLEYLDYKVYSGEEIVQYMIDITPEEKNAPDYYAAIAEKHNFVLKRLDLDEVIEMIKGDLGAMEYIQDATQRYYGSDFEGFSHFEDDSPAPGVTEETLYNPIVIIKKARDSDEGILLDGYSRLTEHIHRSDKTDILAYISI